MTTPERLAVQRNDFEFDSNGDTVRAWYYPARNHTLAGPAGAPAVVLAHGFSLTKDCGLEPYAARFAEAGMHAVVFDYRGWGASDGTPRDVVRLRDQLVDYHAALAATRGLDDVDPARVAVWGTSYSGGTAVVCAAEDGNVAAVVAQVPNLDNLATARFLATRIPLVSMIRLGARLARDVAAAALGRKPVYVTSIGRPGDFAAYVSDESMSQVDHIAGPTWNNRVALRDFVRLPLLRPVNYLGRLPCRIQLHACTRDDLTPSRPTIAAAQRLGDRAELVCYDAGHFGIYVGVDRSRALDSQTTFLTQELTQR